jgi:DNA-binding HxlR family transcriptional regulator
MALEIFGDKWTLLVLRDLLFKNLRTFKEFQSAGEGIASNVLADRLQRLEAEGLLARGHLAGDARVVAYAPTDKALDLLPVLVEIVLWSAQHHETAAPPEVVARMASDRQGFIEEIRGQFRPRATAAGASRKGVPTRRAR